MVCRQNAFHTWEMNWNVVEHTVVQAGPPFLKGQNHYQQLLVPYIVVSLSWSQAAVKLVVRRQTLGEDGPHPWVFNYELEVWIWMG